MGKPFEYRLFIQYFHHAVDHSQWAGLNLASHSMRIRGVTIWHAAKVQPSKIKELGHWKTEVMLHYIRDAWLKDPDQLRAMGKFISGRTVIYHLFCQCRAAPTCMIGKQSKKDKIKRIQAAVAEGRVPALIADLITMLKSLLNMILHISASQVAPESFQGNQRLFNITILTARQCLLAER